MIKRWQLAAAFVLVIGAGLPVSSGSASAAIPLFASEHHNRSGGSSMGFTIRSDAFGEGGGIPPKFTCEGDDLSPELKWSEAPSLTKSYALIVDDPDAPGGTWTHWIVWNIPAMAMTLSEALPKQKTLDDGTRQGMNDFKRIGYGGPCPPPGKPHRYFFRLYALGDMLDLKAGARRDELESAMQELVLTHTTLMGTYAR